jgi:glutathione S-transferase
MTYDLWYWPSIPGRGEFVRLAMEAAGLPYRDRARDDGVEALLHDMEKRQQSGIAPYAPPYLVTPGGLCIGQTAHILAWLADRHGFGGKGEDQSLQLIQLQLDISDLVEEVHTTHHPLATGKYYEDQKDAAIERARSFREERIGKYCDHFERALGAHAGPFVCGDEWSHVDTSLFQVIEGLHHAFPRAMAEMQNRYPRLHSLRDAVAEVDTLRAYRGSARCIAFNEDGIFRHYPELDGPGGSRDED